MIYRRRGGEEEGGEEEEVFGIIIVIIPETMKAKTVKYMSAYGMLNDDIF